jgi:hypothetical protein
MMAMGPNIRFKIESVQCKNELQAATVFLHLGERHGHKLFSITLIQYSFSFTLTSWKYIYIYMNARACVVFDCVTS